MAAITLEQLNAGLEEFRQVKTVLFHGGERTPLLVRE
jgi:hypothetical protein